jgi:4-amino-4-deoxy-L-arabinose transferase-like glycosyltransferase
MTSRGRAPSRWRGDSFLVALGLIALAALIARVTYVLLTRGEPASDGIHYHRGALQLVDGLGFINPLSRRLSGEVVQDAVHPPAWTVVLAAPSALGLRSVLSHQIFACLIGTGTVVMTGLAGRAAFGPRVGLVAASLAAVYPNIWLYEWELATEPLAALWVATIIWLAFRYRATPRLRFAVALGAAVGLGALTRAEILATAGLIVAPLILFSSAVAWRQRLAWSAAAAVACIGVIAPWAAYNSTRFDRPVPLSTSMGPALQSGNCSRTYHGELLGYADFGCVTFTGPVVDIDPSVADGQYRELAIDFMRENASRVPIVSAVRLGRTFNIFRPFQQVHLESERGTNVWVLRLALVAYWILLPFAIGGVIIARRRGVAVYPLLAFPATVALATLLTIGAVRYRAPAEVPLVILAAVALDLLLDRRRSSADRPALYSTVVRDTEAIDARWW